MLEHTKNKNNQPHNTKNLKQIKYTNKLKKHNPCVLNISNTVFIYNPCRKTPESQIFPST